MQLLIEIEQRTPTKNTPIALKTYDFIFTVQTTVSELVQLNVVKPFVIAPC